jgi:hypothetical protein
MAQDKMAAGLAVGGVLFPYAVGIASTAMLGKDLGSVEFYYSGQLQAWDDATFVWTLVAYGLGLLGCVPWFWGRLTILTPKGRLCAGFALALLAAVHFAAVFAVQFLCYYHAGGIL